MKPLAVSSDKLKLAVLYARVSTDEQAERGFSLTSQLEACRKYAVDQGFTVVGEIIDDYTGTKLDRPGLDEVRSLIERREVNTVIVHASDRLTRKLAHMLILREEWQRASVELHYVRRGKSEDTPESRMTENIEGVFNEYWREKILEASRRGMDTRAKSGKANGGKPPYGYAYTDGQFVVVEAEAEVVRLIFQWYTVGDEDGKLLSEYSIAKRLSEMKIPTPGERKGYKRARDSGMWNDGAVHRLLTYEAYAGVWRYGRLIGNSGKGGKRSVENTIPVSVPASISRETWDAAQTRKEYNKRMSKRNAKRQYLLRRMVKCGCGRVMTGYGGKGWYRYRCSAAYTQYSGMETTLCREEYRDVSGPVLEELAWQYVLAVMSDSGTFEKGLRDAQAEEQSAIRPK